MDIEIRRKLNILIACNLILEVLILLRILRVLKKKLKSWWVKPHITSELRDQYGFYSTLFTYFKFNDEEEFVRLTRMSIHQFNVLLNLVQGDLEKQTVQFRLPIHPELRLIVTLHYLAHSGNVITTASVYRIGRSTIYNIIKETYTVLVRVLKPSRHLSQPDQNRWLEI